MLFRSYVPENVGEFKMCLLAKLLAKLQATMIYAVGLVKRTDIFMWTMTRRDKVMLSLLDP